MTTKARAILAGMLAVLSVSAATTATAYAEAQWQVEEKVLGAGQTVEIGEVRVNEPFGISTTIGGTAIKVTCKAVQVSEGFLEGPRGGGAHSVKLSECTTSNEQCKVGAITLKLIEIVLHFQLNQAVELKPKTGSELGPLEITGSLCPLKGSYKVTGQITANAPKGEEQLKSHKWEFSSTSGSKVEVEKEKTVFTGIIEIWIGIFHIIWGNT